MKTTRLLVLTLVLALSAAIVAGCGSSSGSGGDDDPAALIPAGAPVYLEGVVRPDGQVRSDLEGALKKILRTDDPGAKIRQLIDDSGKSDKVTFKDDVEPWLGNRVGFAITALHNGQDADYAAVISSKDDAKAEKLLAKQKGDIAKRSYNGTDYRYDSKEKTATAVIDHRVVVATEGGLKAVVDGKGKDHLADANGLTAVRSKVAQDRIGLFYLDVQGFVRTISQQASSDPQVGAMLQSFASAAPKTLGAALQAQPDALRIDAVSIGTPKSSTTSASGADILATLPGNSWLGLGVGDLGQTLDRVLQTVAGSGGITGVGVNALLEQFKKQTSLDLRQDVLGWMGDAGVFVGGTTSADLGGALVIKTTDPAKTKRTMAVLERYARQSSGTKISSLQGKGIDDGFTAQDTTGPAVHVALAGDRFVVAIGGKDVLEQAISPGQQLGSSPAFTAATGKLGNGLRPSFYLDFTQVTKLIETFAGTDADFQKAKPYLGAFGAIVAGAKSEGSGVTRSRFVVTLR
jgi:predicted small secreted protein